MSALPNTGEISFTSINNALGRVTRTQLALSDPQIRTLTGVASGQIRFNNFYGKSLAPTFPSGSVYSLQASSLSLSSGSKINSWGSFGQTNSTFQPTYKVDSLNNNLPYVEFLGTSTSRQFLEWNFTSNVLYGTGGGSTIVLFCKYRNSLVQFNRSISHNGSSGNANVFEWILGEDVPRSLHPKYFYVNSTAAHLSSNQVPLGKWTLYQVRFTNGSPNKAEIFVNNPSTPAASNMNLTGMSNSTITRFTLGADGTNSVGQNCDFHYTALYPRALSNSELTNIYNTFVSYIQP